MIKRSATRGAGRLVAVLNVISALALVLAPGAAAAPAVAMSAQSGQILDKLLQARDDSASADALSAQFLGTPYGANTLIGSTTVPEQLVVELARVDCFTYADYVEALKRSTDRGQFIDNLRAVRYRGGEVDFAKRKHFFTDWSAVTPVVATDITATLGEDTATATKKLNQKDGGGTYLAGLPVVSRSITYLPGAAVDADVLAKLRTGDYIGAYATDGGLDVTHVGIFINTPDGPVFRNASSLAADNKVVDIPLNTYLGTVPGIVVLRPVV